MLGRLPLLLLVLPALSCPPWERSTNAKSLSGAPSSVRRVFTLPEQFLALDSEDLVVRRRGGSKERDGKRERGAALPSDVSASLARVAQSDLGSELDKHSASLKSGRTATDAFAAGTRGSTETKTLRVAALGMNEDGVAGDGGPLSGHEERTVGGRSGKRRDSIPQSVLKSGLDSVRSQVHYCYDMELEVAPDSAGRVVATLEVDNNGRVKSADVDVPRTMTSGLRSCMQKSLARMRFPGDPSRGTVQITYHWDLLPSG